MKKALPFLILLLPILIFFAPVATGKLPLPADTIPGLYHPMRDALADEYPNGPPYKNYLITDSVRQQYPWREYSIGLLKSGQLPWWNPYNFSGTPHLANFQSATFYPLNLVFWLLPFSAGWSLLVMLQPILGGFFLYLYLRRLRVTKEASLFGAFTWIFSGFFIAWLEWNTAAHVAVWTPLILLSLDKILATGHKRYYLVLLFGLISQVFAGYPQPWIYLSLLQLAYLLWRLKGAFIPQKILGLGAVYVTFLLVASLQLLPTFRYAPLTNRDFDQGGLEYHLVRPDWFLPYQNLVQVIVPDFFGNPATLNYWGVFNYTEFVSFIGIIPAIFALSALFWLRAKPPKATRFFAVILGVSLLLALKNPLSVALLKLNLPFLGNSQPSRLIVVIDFVLAVLAALGFHRFQKSPAKARPALLAITAIILSLWLLLLTARTYPLGLLSQHLSVTQRNLILPTLELGFALVVMAALFLLRRLRPGYRLILISSLILVSAFSGLRFAKKFTPFSDPAFLYPDTRILTYLKQHQGLHRYATLDNRILAPNLNLPYRLYTIEGYDPMYLATYGRLISATDYDHLPPQSRPFNRHVLTNQYRSPVLDVLGVKYFLSLDPVTDPALELILEEGQTKLYQNSEVFPRAFLTDQTNPFELTAASVTPARITAYTPHQVTIAATAGRQTRLVLTDAWYPGWQVTVDRMPATLENWNGLRATIIPEGTHEIVFYYRYPQL